jgi:hypothetical protein
VDPGMDLAEGGSALGLDSPADADHAVSDFFTIVRNRRTGYLIAAWIGANWAGVGAAEDFGTSDSAFSNIITRHMQVNTLWAPLKPGVQILGSVHYCSPKPLSHPVLHSNSSKLIARLRGMGAVTVPAAKERPSVR